MLNKIITTIKSNKIILSGVGLVSCILAGGLCSTVPEIKTISFFLLTELFVLGATFFAVRLALKIPYLREYLRRILSNFILGLHLVAGMVVLGVYFTV